ncbi:MAG: ATP-dependent Clp protease adaptor ClpS [Acidimicrobiia bacterium]|nr:ATP-dependent Clp protease adaptor ClpS [Acidimicrobiia bacterium]
MSIGPANSWKVVVWDDPVNLMSYVTWVFRTLSGRSVDEASRLMLLVHNEGRAVFATAPRERAEMIAFRLLHHGLRVTLEDV